MTNSPNLLQWRAEFSLPLESAVTVLALGVNLAAITAEQTLSVVALDLIYWALKEGRVAEFITALGIVRPTNPHV